MSCSFPLEKNSAGCSDEVIVFDKKILEIQESQERTFWSIGIEIMIIYRLCHRKTGEAI